MHSKYAVGLIWSSNGMYSTDLLMIGPTSHGNGHALFFIKTKCQCRTKSLLSSRLLFVELIDWVIHVDIVYPCWKSCDKAMSCKQITEGFEHHRCCKSRFKRSFYCMRFHDRQNHNEYRIKKNSYIYVRFVAPPWSQNQELKLAPISNDRV